MRPQCTAFSVSFGSTKVDIFFLICNQTTQFFFAKIVYLILPLYRALSLLHEIGISFREVARTKEASVNRER